MDPFELLAGAGQADYIGEPISQRGGPYGSP
jgi:hypothetical protein